MSAEDNYMDESFRKMGEGIRATYHPEFWNEALSQLENEKLDQAFRQAAEQVPFIPNFKPDSEGLSAAFMDDTFRDAAAHSAVTYDASYWEELKAIEPDLILDEAFTDASQQVVANYSPLFWGDANTALENEGLHHEYQHVYWDEARDLLDKADRKVFFTKWTSVAIALLLISFFGLNSNYEFKLSKVDRIELKESHSNNLVLFAHNDDNKNEVFEKSEMDQGHSRLNANFVSNSQSFNVFESELNEEEGNVLIVELNEEVRADQLIARLRQESTGELEVNKSVEREMAKQMIENNAHSRFEEGSNFEVAENTLLNNIKLELEDVQLKNTVTRIPIARQTRELPDEDKVELKPLQLKPLHQVSLVGLAGLGQNYGVNTYLFTKRYGAHLEYVYAGSKGYRSGNQGHFELGGQLGFNYVQCDGLGIENQVKLFKVNGEVEKYWRNLQIFDLFYATASIFANYSLNQHHKIRLGLGVDRLFAVQSNMAFRMDDDKGIQTINNNWGVQEGVSTYDFKVSLGYEYQINRSWAFQLNLTSGLFNRTENDFFMAPIDRDIERNLTIGIRRTLFTKLE